MVRCKVYQRMGVWVCEIPTVRRVACVDEASARAHAELFDSIYIDSERVPRAPGSPAAPRTKPKREAPEFVPIEQPNNQPQEGDGIISLGGNTIRVTP